MSSDTSRGGRPRVSEWIQDDEGRDAWVCFDDRGSTAARVEHDEQRGYVWWASRAFLPMVSGRPCKYADEAMAAARAVLDTWADVVSAEPEPTCTGLFAVWCPVHGDCACPYEHDNPENGRTFDGPNCPLHAPASTHGEDEEPGPSHAPGERARQLFRSLTDAIESGHTVDIHLALVDLGEALGVPAERREAERIREADAPPEEQPGDDCPPSCTNPDPNHRHPALPAQRIASAAAEAPADVPPATRARYERLLAEHQRTREEERKAWARLVKAERALRREEAVSDGEGYASHAAREEVDSAVQALRAMGVDVDALLGEAAPAGAST